jgi:hypothetical protein
VKEKKKKENKKKEKSKWGKGEGCRGGRKNYEVEG